MQLSYETYGSCAKRIDFDVENGVVINVSFVGGCVGNTLALSALVSGMHVAEVIKRLKGIACQGDTSCPDQLARALEQLK